MMFILQYFIIHNYILHNLIIIYNLGINPYIAEYMVATNYLLLLLQQRQFHIENELQNIKKNFPNIESFLVPLIYNNKDLFHNNKFNQRIFTTRDLLKWGNKMLICQSSLYVFKYLGKRVVRFGHINARENISGRDINDISLLLVEKEVLIFRNFILLKLTILFL